MNLFKNSNNDLNQGFLVYVHIPRFDMIYCNVSSYRRLGLSIDLFPSLFLICILCVVLISNSYDIFSLYNNVIIVNNYIQQEFISINIFNGTFWK